MFPLRHDLALTSFAAIFAILFLFAPVASCDEEDNIKRMVASWKQRQTAVRSLLAEWGEINASGAISENEQPRQKMIFTLGDSGKARLERHPSVMKAGVRSRSGVAISSYDGHRNYQYTSAVGPEDWPRGIVWSDEKYDEIHSLQIHPWLLHFRPFQTPTPDLSSEKLHVVDSGVLVNGHSCLVVERSDLTVSTTGLYWVDEERGFSILRYVEKSREKATLELNIDYKKDPQIGWIPSTWDAAFVNGNFSVRGRLVRYELNIDVPDSVFVIDFPEGTIVFDRDLGYNALWLPDGKKRIITPEESASGFKYQDLFKTGPGDLATTFRKPKEESDWVVSLVILNLSAIALLAVLFVIRRRKSSSHPEASE